MTARSRGGARGSFVALIVLVAAFTAPLRGDISLRWQNGTEAAAPLLADRLVASGIISDFVELVAENLAFETPLVVTVGAAGGPDYDAATNTIRLPYGFLQSAVRAQALLRAMGDGDGSGDGSGDRAFAMQRALDVVEYTLYHLLGHALAGSGSVEVDELAEAWSSWAVLAHRPRGAAEWRRSSRRFADASQRLDGSPEDFWHAHALSAARERVVDCWIVGREPSLALAATSRQADVLDRIDACRTSWTRLDADAHEVLAPVLLDGAPLGRDPVDAE